MIGNEGWEIHYKKYFRKLLHFWEFYLIVDIRGAWIGGRVVEGAALEMLLCSNVYEGSNPSLSVFIH